MFDWGGVINAVVDAAPGVITAVKTKPVNPLVGNTGGYLPSATGVPGVADLGEILKQYGGGILGPTAEQLGQKTMGAALKQYWWVIAIPVALLLFLIVKPMIGKRKRW